MIKEEKNPIHERLFCNIKSYCDVVKANIVKISSTDFNVVKVKREDDGQLNDNLSDEETEAHVRIDDSHVE